MQKRKQHLLKLWLFPVLCLGLFAAFKGDNNHTIQEQASYGKGKIERVIVNKKGESVCVGTTQRGRGFSDKKAVFFTIANAKGKIITNTTINSPYTEGVNSIIQTSDDNYTIVGFKDTLTHEKQKKQVAWLVKINEKGAILWDMTVDSLENSVFTDVTETLNGDLWLTGETGKKLWVVKVDTTDKSVKKYLFPATSANAATRGNGMAWVIYETRLIIVGTEVVDKQKNLLLIEFDTEGGFFDTQKTEKIPKAEGKGIVRDGWGTFGVVGTKYNDNKFGDILFFRYDKYDRFDLRIKQREPFGKALFNDEGLAIAKDEAGNFIVVGRHFEKDSDKKSQAWLCTITANGVKKSSLGGNFNDEFTSVAVSTHGKVFAAGNKGAFTWLVSIDDAPSKSPSNPQETVKANVEFTMSNVYKPKKKDGIINLGYEALTLSWKVESTDKNIRNEDVHVLVNGERYKNGSRGRDGKPDTKFENGYYYYEYTETIVLMENAKIDIEVAHKGQIIRSKESLKIRVKRPNLYVLAIGINYEGGKAPKLDYTDEDAAAIITSFKTQEQFYKTAKYLQLTSKDSTTADFMRRQINTFFKDSDSSDVAILFVASHGSTNSVKDAFVWASDFDPLERTGYLNYDRDISQQMAHVKGKKCIIIDACRSLNDGVKGVNDKSDEQNAGTAEAITKISNASSAYRSLSSCSGPQSSYESNCLKHGIFTYALLEAFKQKPKLDCNNVSVAEIPSKKVVTFEELSKYLKDRVPTLADKLKGYNQTPKAHSDKQSEDDIPIFIFKNEQITPSVF